MAVVEPLPEGYSLTVALPTLNEAATIAEVVGAARPFAAEVLVIDGHSSDETAILAEAAGARVVLDPRTGKGGAVRYALEVAAGDVVVFMDADGSHAAEDIPRLAAPIRAGDADLVVGCRMTGGSEELHGDLLRLLRLNGTELVTLAVNARWKAGLTDVQNGFRAVRRDVGLALALREDGFSVQEEMVMKALRRSYRVVNVPSFERRRRHGESRVVLHRDGLASLWCVVKHMAGIGR
jgi:dolichol-phosphate mannosyltransferase